MCVYMQLPPSLKHERQDLVNQLASLYLHLFRTSNICVKIIFSSVAISKEMGSPGRHIKLNQDFLRHSLIQNQHVSLAFIINDMLNGIGLVTMDNMFFSSFS